MRKIAILSFFLFFIINNIMAPEYFFPAERTTFSTEPALTMAGRLIIFLPEGARQYWAAATYPML